MKYFMAENGRQTGPFEIGELLRMGLRPQTLVWCETMSDWQRADRVPELMALFDRAIPRDHVEARARVEHASPPPQPAAAPNYQYASPTPHYPMHAVDAGAQSRGTRIAAGICGILLGGLGIHKFVLGYTTAGVITLLITICTCGIAWPIMKIIGIIEGIMYLAKNDAEFYRTYVVGRREWF
jgi:TM2 domain-containing membrane protein YozV